jgi:hypothetical protein
MVPSRADLANDLEKLTTDTAELETENARLRQTNAQMLAALRYALPLLRDALPVTVSFDWTKEAVRKVQDAIAEAERDV